MATIKNVKVDPRTIAVGKDDICQQSSYSDFRNTTKSVEKIATDNTMITETLKSFADTNKEIVTSNSQLTQLCNDMKNEIADIRKSNELTKFELRISTFYGFGITLIAVVEALFLSGILK